MDVSQVAGVRSDISEMLSKIREVSNKSKVFTGTEVAAPAKSFEGVLSIAKGALTSVNQTQVETEALKNAYVTGDSSVSMSQVIIASQKSKLAFEGLVAVRNKILDAYKEIMNMPI